MSKILKTKRLVIRPLAMTDYKNWKAAHLQSVQTRNIWDHSLLPPEELKRNYFLKDLKNRKLQSEADHTYIYGIFLKSTGEYLGEITVMNVVRGKIQTGSLGIGLLNNNWGVGIGKEIGSAMPKLVFKEIGLHRVEGAVEAANKRSVGLAKSVGLKREGLKKKAALLRGKWVDLVLFAATSEDFGINWKRKS
jgi:ribosomal-protein-alanine N-acetyltransferase